MIEFYNQEFLNFEYLRPLEDCLNNEHLKKEDIVEEHKNRINRKLFYCKEWFLNDIEEEFLSKVDLLLESNQNIKKPKCWKIGDSLNLIHLSNFNEELFLDLIKNHWKFIDNWENSNFSEVEKMLNSGIIYQYGRDKNFYPIIIIDFEKFIPKTEDSDYFLTLNFIIKFIKTYMLLPDYVEKINIMFNLNNLGVFNFKTNIVQDIIIYIDNYFSNIINNYYILNLNLFLKITYSTLIKFLNERIYNKIEIISDTNELEKFNIKKNQLEKKFNGDLENLEIFWPPVDTFINGRKWEIYDLLKNKDDIFYFDDYHYENINNKKPNKTVKYNNNSSKNFSNILHSFQHKNIDLNENRNTYKTNFKEENNIFENENYEASILSKSDSELNGESLKKFNNPYFNNESEIKNSSINESIFKNKIDINNTSNSKTGNINESALKNKIDIINNDNNIDDSKDITNKEEEKINFNLNLDNLEKIEELSQDQSSKRIKNFKVKKFDIFDNSDKKKRNVKIFSKNKKNNLKKTKENNILDDTIIKNEKFIDYLEKKYNVREDNNLFDILLN